MLASYAIVLIAVLGSVSAAPLLSHREYAASFVSWMSQHNASYESAVFLDKFAIYKANHLYVERHNERHAQGAVSFYLALNENADLTVREYRAKLGYKHKARPVGAASEAPDWVCTDYGWDCPSSSSSTGAAVELSSSATPMPTPVTSSSSTGAPAPAPVTDSKDWRGSPLLGPVKNQGSCGSCWSFASTASLQAAWALKSGQSLVFSEQQLVDCSNNGVNSCDRGGTAQDSWDYMLGGHFPMTEDNYPYTAQSGNGCQYDATKATTATFQRAVHIPRGNEAALARASQGMPAITVAIDASNQSFQFYKGGVYEEPACGSEELSLDHAVTVVGYGTDATSGKDYWIVQNSWAQTWGENGYIRMRRGGNMCGIATDASYIVA